MVKITVQTLIFNRRLVQSLEQNYMNKLEKFKIKLAECKNTYNDRAK